jgi:hypothetical protein
MTPTVTAWIVVIAVGMFIVSIAAGAFLLVRLPATYFLDKHHRESRIVRHPILRWSLLILRNILGAICVGVGVLMLFTPGQGLLTILIGIMLLDFPGKRTLERKLVNRNGIKSSINRLRSRFGRPPLILDE